MNTFKAIVSIAVLTTAGCAPAYHTYSGCQVDCRYCAPPALPYTKYPDCDCHSRAAEEVVAATARTAGEETDDEVRPTNPSAGTR